MSQVITDLAGAKILDEIVPGMNARSVTPVDDDVSIVQLYDGAFTAARPVRIDLQVAWTDGEGAATGAISSSSRDVLVPDGPEGGRLRIKFKVEEHYPVDLLLPLGERYARTLKYSVERVGRGA